MQRSRLLTVQRSRIAQWICTAGLILAIVAAAGASASRVWAEAPVTTQGLIPSEAITLKTAVGSSGHLYAIVGGALYVSSDGGGEWRRQTTSSAPYLFPASVAGDSQNDLVVYMGTNYNSLFKSVDGGVNFARSSTGLGAGSQVAVTAILIPELHPGLLMAATAYWVGTSQRTLVPQGFYLSTNRGQSWFQFSNDVGAMAVTRLALDSALVVAATSDDGSTQRIPLDKALSDLMQYGAPDVQAQVPLAMALLGMETGEMELTRRFWTGENLSASAAGLALLGTPTAIRTLVSAMADTTDTSRRQLAMHTLVPLGEKAIPPLITALSDDNPMLRAKAAETLGWIGSRSARPALLDSLVDMDRVVRATALWALGEIH